MLVCVLHIHICAYYTSLNQSITAESFYINKFDMCILPNDMDLLSTNNKTRSRTSSFIPTAGELINIPFSQVSDY